MKKLLFWGISLLAFLLVSAVVVNLYRDLQEEHARFDASNEALRQVKQKRIKAFNKKMLEPVVETVYWGQPFVLGQNRYELVKTGMKDKYGDLRAGKGSVLVTVTYKVTNLSSTPDKQPEHRLYILDPENNEYLPSDAFGIQVRLGDPRFALTDLQPNFTRTVLAGCEAPAKAITKGCSVVFADPENEPRKLVKVPLDQASGTPKK